MNDNGAAISRLPSGILLGVGLGGFVDGILLHQILQWHNMASAILPPLTMMAMSRNMTIDGLFHAATWVITLAGVVALHREGRRHVVASIPRFSGHLLLGWGTFNLVEGVIDHHLLQLHHVRDLPSHVPAYDWLFLLVSGVGLIVGWVLTIGKSRVPNAA